MLFTSGPNKDGKVNIHLKGMRLVTLNMSMLIAGGQNLKLECPVGCQARPRAKKRISHAFARSALAPSQPRKLGFMREPGVQSMGDTRSASVLA